MAETAGTIVSNSARRGGLPAADDVGSLIPVVANPLTARMFKGVNTTMDEGQTMVPVSFKPSHFTRGKDGAPQDVALSLSADADKGDQDQVVLAPIAFDCKAGGDTGFAIGDVPGALRGEGHGGGHAAIAFQAYDLRGREGGAQFEGPHDTANIRAASGGSSRSYLQVGIGHNSGVIWRVRRLMPVECERLQGLPDGYTDVMWRGKPAADGPRYKALGNAMSTNVMRWIGRRIEMVNSLSMPADLA